MCRTGGYMKKIKKLLFVLCVMTLLFTFGIPVMGGRAEEAVSTSDDFLLYVESVYYVTNRGTVVTGRVVEGTLAVSDDICLKTYDINQNAVSKDYKALAIEMFNKKLDYAQRGDNVGVMISTLNITSTIHVGDALTAKNSVYALSHGKYNDGRMVITGVFTADSSRTDNVQSGKYQAHIYEIRSGSDTTASLQLEKGSLAPGESCYGYLQSFYAPRVVYVGQQFKLTKGGHTYGVFEVSGVYDELAEALDGAGQIIGIDFPINTIDSDNNTSWQPENDGVGSKYYLKNGRESTLTVHLNLLEDSVITFDYRIRIGRNYGNSDLSNEHAYFTVDGTEKFNCKAKSTAWSPYFVQLPAGKHTLQWTYRKGGDGESTSANGLLLRNLSFYPGKIVVALDTAEGKLPDRFDQMIVTNRNTKIELPVPTRDGYSFLGWFGPSSNTESVDLLMSENNLYLMNGLSDSILLTAHWEPVGWNVISNWGFEADSISNTNWTFTDADNDGKNWYLNSSHGESVTYSKPYEGKGCIVSDSNLVGSSKPDNWAVSPAVTLPDRACEVAVMSRVHYREVSEIKNNFAIYAGLTNEISKMTKVGGDYTVTDQWQEFTADLSAFAGKTVYIAIRHYNVSNQLELTIDRVQVRKTLIPVTLMGLDSHNERYVTFRSDTLLSDGEVTMLEEGPRYGRMAYAYGDVYLFSLNTIYSSKLADLSQSTSKIRAYGGNALSVTYDYSRDTFYVLINPFNSNEYILARFFPSTNKVVSLGKVMMYGMNMPISAITAGPDGILYGLMMDGSLVTINPDTLKAELTAPTCIGTINGNQDMCYDYTNDLIYYLVNGSFKRSLYVIDPKTKESKLLTNIKSEGDSGEIYSLVSMFVVPDVDFAGPAITTLGGTMTPSVIMSPFIENDQEYTITSGDTKIFKMNGSKATAIKTGSASLGLKSESGVVAKCYARSEFEDVTRTSDKGKKPYYYDAVYWAVDSGVTAGVKKDGVYKIFNPQGNCTRGQMISFIWRMAGCPAPESDIISFNDVKSDAYYYKAILWAAEKGIAGGYNDGSFRPNEPCTRGHAVTFMWRYLGKPEPQAKSSDFTDVKDTKAYYYKAELWATENGITGGYSDGTFRPTGNCTRAQMVTFLYRLKYNDVIVYDERSLM